MASNSAKEMSQNEIGCVSGGKNYCICKFSSGYIITWTTLASNEEACNVWCCLGDGHVDGVVKWSFGQSQSEAELNTHDCSVDTVTKVRYCLSALVSTLVLCLCKK